jgi:D-alanyl-D-alanine carboxypeptidase/D-alanyl-D-alanine-endopeptidase (penicillin-binding protein 4)
MNAWAREALGLDEIALVDHSGLNDASRIPAFEMMRALLALSKDGALKPLMKPFVLRNDAGRPMPDHPVAVQAKTGTLHFVSGLAGYVDPPGGTELVFAVFCADLDHRATLTRDELERPEGARGWNRRAKRLQQALIERWSVLHG